jgi:hypothetical protein
MGGGEFDMTGQTKPVRGRGGWVMVVVVVGGRGGGGVESGSNELCGGREQLVQTAVEGREGLCHERGRVMDKFCAMYS